MPLRSIFDFPPQLARETGPPGAPPQTRAVLNEIAHHEDLNPAGWAGTPRNQTVQNEIDYHSQLNHTRRPQDRRG